LAGCVPRRTASHDLLRAGESLAAMHLDRNGLELLVLEGVDSS
jgi:hypothetical protein